MNHRGLETHEQPETRYGEVRRVLRARGLSQDGLAGEWEVELRTDDPLGARLFDGVKVLLGMTSVRGRVRRAELLAAYRAAAREIFGDGWRSEVSVVIEPVDARLRVSLAYAEGAGRTAWVTAQEPCAKAAPPPAPPRAKPRAGGGPKAPRGKGIVIAG